MENLIQNNHKHGHLIFESTKGSHPLVKTYLVEYINFESFKILNFVLFKVETFKILEMFYF